MRGNVDIVTPEGLVEGWCWNEQAPDDRVTVAIHVDGEESGRALACHFRKDLQEAGIGDGGHFFRLLLPDTILRHRRSQKVTLIDPETGATIGDPYTVRFEYGLRFDDRLSELEARSRLVESRIKDLAESANQANASAELFAVVGAFFQRLSDDLARGTASRPEQQLSEAIQATTRALAPITFPASLDPLATVFVEANCSLDQLHRCLAALRRAAAGLSIRVVILDNGSAADAALICTVVQGVQYLRTATDLVAECKRAAAEDASAIQVFLSGYAVIDQTFLTELQSFTDQNAYVGAVGGCTLGSDGRLQQTGFRVADGKLVEGGAASDGDPAPIRSAVPVHALGHAAVAFRRRAIEAVGGFDPIFGDELWAAVIDLCFRLRARGWSVFSHPGAMFSLFPGRGSPVASDVATPSRARDLLTHRWIMDPDAASAAFTGYAAMVGQPDRADEEMEAVRRLQTSGFSVLYLAPEGADTGNIAAFEGAGARIVPDTETLSDIPARIIFSATAEDRIEQFKNGVTSSAQLVVGLPSLVAALEHFGAVGPASPHA